MAQRTNALKLMLRARDEESNTNPRTRGEVYAAISKIIERANTGQTARIRERRQRNRSKIRELLRELSVNAAFHPDDSCNELRRAPAHDPLPGTRLA